MADLSAVAHPTRVAILAAMGCDESSPKDLAEQLDDTTLGTVSYHVRALAGAGLLKRTRTKQVRGAIAHYYRVTPAAAPLLWELSDMASAAAHEVPDQLPAGAREVAHV